MRETLILGLGSNVGFPLKHLREAVRQIETLPGIHRVVVSSVYQSDAQLPDNAPSTWEKPYLNLAMRCETDLHPRALHPHLLAIEKRFGRARDERWAPRTLDIDILAWDGGAYADDTLQIPHPRLMTRPFALLPLLEVFSLPHLPDLQACPTPGAPIPFNTRKIHARVDTPALMGIVNVTPDSFSDGNQWTTLETQLNHCLHLVRSGAEVIDIGAESTRPGATPVSPDEEWRRLSPLLAALHTLPTLLGPDAALRPEISLDTYHPETAKRALDLGVVDWINDVSGQSRTDMCALLRGTDTRYVAMHNLGVPPRPDQRLPAHIDPVDHLKDWAKRTRDALLNAGLTPAQCILDPGLGFGLTPDQHWTVLANLGDIQTAADVPLLAGHSRKSFFKPWLYEDSLVARDLASSLVAFYLAKQRIAFLRVHAVSAVNQSLQLFHQLNTKERNSPCLFSMNSTTPSTLSTC